MNWEHSCGAVLYQLKNGEPYYILVEGSSGFGFPKGHMEANESEIQTAVREIWEETGVHAVVDQSFCRSVEYPVLKKKDTCKKITFFIATYPLICCIYHAQLLQVRHNVHFRGVRCDL